MSNTGNFNIVFILLGGMVLLALFAGAIILQIFLSKRKQLVLGLIIPVLSLLAVPAVMLTSFVALPAQGSTTVVSSKEWIEDGYADNSAPEETVVSVSGAFVMLIALFLGIPLFLASTTILIIVKLNMKRSRQAEITKMNAMDLG